MSDLISKNEAAKIAKGFTFTFAEERQRYMDFLEYCLNNAPTVDAVPVLHSRWKHSRKEDIATCKNCSYEHYLGTYHQYATNFCPNCGASMKGNNND